MLKGLAKISQKRFIFPSIPVKLTCYKDKIKLLKNRKKSV